MFLSYCANVRPVLVAGWVTSMVMSPASAAAQNASSPAADSIGRKDRFNTLVLRRIETMPKGGGYATSRKARDGLKASIVQKGRPGLDLQPKAAQPSFCSAATYLVFVGVIKDLMDDGRLRLAPEVVAELLVRDQPDGEGVWGRWNANGPGTARLLHELGAGRSFSDIQEAAPGDFLKIWWNNHIGAKEAGHSVIYLGTKPGSEGDTQLVFWSSNKPDGYGIRTIPLSKAKRLLFTRLENPRAVERVIDLPRRDAYLASMLIQEHTEAEMLQMTGAPRAAAARPDGASATRQNVALFGTAPILKKTKYGKFDRSSQTSAIRAIQTRLAELGLYHGQVDGDAGPQTMKAIIKWQTAEGINPDGLLDDEALKKLGVPPGPPT